MLGSKELQQYFASSSSVRLQQDVSVEWNYNLFQSPYVTVASNGAKATVGSQWTASGCTISETEITKSEYFQGKRISTTQGSFIVTLSVTTTNKKAYKVVFFARTDSSQAISMSTSVSAPGYVFGSDSKDIDSIQWKKFEMYVGSEDPIPNFNIFLNVSSRSSANTTFDVYVSTPEVYETTLFDYKNGSLWPTDAPFNFFRPGESYVESGNSSYNNPAGLRTINSELSISGAWSKSMPCSPITYMPSVIIGQPSNPLYKNGLVSPFSPYKYFVSEYSSAQSICGVYDSELAVNKIVLKFNLSTSTPTVSVVISNTITGQSDTISVTPNEAGVAVLYWNEQLSQWSTNKWTVMPKFGNDGSITVGKLINKIVVTQTSATVHQQFSDLNELKRMHLVEVSPRLEVNISDFVQNIEIDKTLDNKSNSVPISSIDSNSANLTISAIPLSTNGNYPLSIFSNEGSNTLLNGLLRKNVKFYIFFKLIDESSPLNNSIVQGGAFYSDRWEEEDVSTVSVSAFDVTKYLQTLPSPDYVSQGENVFDTISNIMNLAGFTDYDYDSLYAICNDEELPLDLSFYFVNSREKTVFEALREIFAAYQIGAYVDEFGIMRFISLLQILKKDSSDAVAAVHDIDSIQVKDVTYISNLQDNGYQQSISQKIGKISIRYQSPKIKKSLTLANVYNPAILDSDSIILTTSNDIVWQQQSLDSIGFNYLDKSISNTSQNYFHYNRSDLDDVLHTFSVDHDGYAMIENEIVSFKEKEFLFTTSTGAFPRIYSIKNNTDLQSKLNKYSKLVGNADIMFHPTGRIVNIQRGMFGTNISAHQVMTPTTGFSSRLTVMTLNGSSFGPGGNASVRSDNKVSISTYAAQSSKTMLTPNSELDSGFSTYSTKITFNVATGQTSSVPAAGGIFFNLTDGLQSPCYFVEIAQMTDSKYGLVVYSINSSGAKNIINYADITAVMNNIFKNYPVVQHLNPDGTKKSDPTKDYSVNLRVSKWTDDYVKSGVTNVTYGSTVFKVFINDVEITGWNKTLEVNPATRITRLNTLPVATQTNSKFGFYASSSSAYPEYSAGTSSSSVAFSELYATQTPIKDRSISYYHQTSEFLNKIVSGQRSTEKTYFMQTRPEIVGLNYYDVEYTTPAAVSVDVLKVSYVWYYFPSNLPIAQEYVQSIRVNENGLAYSTPINSGFKARFAIINNTKHLVFLKKEADSQNTITVDLNLWTPQIIALTDPETIDVVIDQTNASETLQIDSSWIQSQDAAALMANAVSVAVENFSKDVSVTVFGNPLIQVGDVIIFKYLLKNIEEAAYIVQRVAQKYDGGLETVLTLNKL